MTESQPSETFEIDDESLQQFMDGAPADEEADAPEYHPILQVWQAVLEPARQEMTTKVTPQWAQRIIGNHVGIGFADMEDFRDLYFTRLLHMASFIAEAIEEDPESLNQLTPKEDLEHNSQHYRELILAWNRELLRWEMEWHTSSPTAAIEIAATGEIFKIFFGSPQQPGIVAHLDQIGFEFNEADQKWLVHELELFKEGL